MPTREEMNSLAQHIIASYDSRTDDITNIRGETEQQLRNYDRAHNAMAQELRTELARVQPALDQAETARKQDEAQRAQGRAQVVAQLQSDVSNQLQELDGIHNAMAQRLRAELARVQPALDQAETARKQDEAQRAQDRDRIVAQRKSDVSDQLTEMDRAHNAMAQELRTELARVQPALDQAETARKQDEAQRAQDRDRVVAQRKSDVSDQLNELHNTQAGARDSWQNMAATMRQRRTGAVAEAPVVVEEEAPAVVEEEAPVAVAEAAPPVVEDATGPEVAEEEAVERAEVGDVTDEFTALSDQVFEHLASHPDGTRLTELEAEFGMKRFQAGRVVRHLMDDGKVEKQDLLYFAI